MALSAELEALVGQAETALLDARILLSEFRSTNAGKPQRCDHSSYMSVWRRAQSQPWTVTPEEQTMLDTARVMTSEDFATVCVGPGDDWNPSAITRRKGAQFAALGEAQRTATFAKAPPVKDKAYYRKLWMRGGGSSARAECIAHAASKSMALWQYKSWLWADEKKPMPPGATPQAVAWAERQLKGAV
jgi:hypothetical protein